MKITSKNPFYVDFLESTLLYQMYEDFKEALEKNKDGEKLDYWDVLCNVGIIYAPYFAKLQQEKWLPETWVASRYIKYRDEVKDYEKIIWELEAERKSNKNIIWNRWWKIAPKRKSEAKKLELQY